MGLYYNPVPDAYAKRLVNVTPSWVGVSTPAWNAHQWDLRS